MEFSQMHSVLQDVGKGSWLLLANWLSSVWCTAACALQELYLQKVANPK